MVQKKLKATGIQKFLWIALSALAFAVAACSDSETASDTTSNTSADDITAVNANDRTLGDPNAPITIIEYASVTCGHCAHFHKTAFKKLKQTYIDTGKVHFVFREFPTAPADRAVAGFLMARCLPEERYFPMIDALMRTQETWAFGQDAYNALKNMALGVGMTGEQFDACIRDTDGIARIQKVQDDANKKLNISGTPSFVINGKLYSKVYTNNETKTMENFTTIIDGLLAAQ